MQKSIANFMYNPETDAPGEYKLWMLPADTEFKLQGEDTVYLVCSQEGVYTVVTNAYGIETAMDASLEVTVG